MGMGDVSPANGGSYHQIANWCGGKKEEAQVQNQIPNIIYTNDCQYANYSSTFVKWNHFTFAFLPDLYGLIQKYCPRTIYFEKNLSILNYLIDEESKL